jgi:hypothetical protein
LFVCLGREEARKLTHCMIIDSKYSTEMTHPLWQASYDGDARAVEALLADERLGLDVNLYVMRNVRRAARCEIYYNVQYAK